MNWLSGFTGRVEPGAALAERTWFRLGGPARWLVSPASTDELGDVLRRAADEGVCVRPLGAGANVLVRDDGFDGVVVRLDEPSFTATRFDGSWVIAGGGVDLMRLTHDCASRGLSGLEGLAGIPATVGGAIRMNAGGRYGQIGDAVEQVCVVDNTGAVQRWDRDGLRFGYRSSNLGPGVVVAACFALREADPSETLATFKRVWAEKKATQPLADHSGGCIFKNPPGRSAGALIDQAGLKGTRRGGASVSTKHANFIVTTPPAKSADVLAVIDHVRETVSRRWGVDLELEIDIW